MIAIAKALTCSTLAISLCTFVVLSQQTQTGSQPSQRASPAEVAEESRLNTSLVELYKAGKFDQALPVARRVLELREKMFGPQDPVVGTALSNLAEIYRAKKQNDEAQRLYRRSLTILERDPAAALLRRLQRPPGQAVDGGQSTRGASSARVSGRDPA